MKTIKEIRVDLVQTMIEKYVESIGLSRTETFNEEDNLWRWKHGSAQIEVFVQSVEVGQGDTREYLRIFSYLATIPKISGLSRELFLRKLLEINDINLGVKLTLVKGADKVYATYERDIRGMDYGELAICIADLEWWADKLDDELKSYEN